MKLTHGRVSIEVGGKSYMIYTAMIPAIEANNTKVSHATPNFFHRHNG